MGHGIFIRIVAAATYLKRYVPKAGRLDLRHLSLTLWVHDSS